MNYSEIETFLAIAENRSLTKAAEKLYLSQSTVSYRLKSLEQELGNQLIIREQGKSVVTLSPKGEEFISIAHMWMALLKDTNSWKSQKTFNKLKIGSVDSLNTCIFSEFYKRLLRSSTPMILNVGTHWTVTIHKFIENYETDVGFVLWQIPSNNIISKPLFSERMVLISSISSNFPDKVHPKELNPQNEIYLYCGPSFQSWHDYWWDNTKREYSSVDTIALLSDFFDLAEFWSIVPISIARNLIKKKPIKISEILDAPPDRICFQITNKYPLPSKTKPLEIFDEHLKSFLKSDHFMAIIK
ncbi:MAG: LysR family transcriptional regulator [Sedimentibacter sp.]|uniref:LysR family transcriptional regulator n=1 Tax=Sedimentibacter sp. TaxID=1960295 RepID=UPI003158CA73